MKAIFYLLIALAAFACGLLASDAQAQGSATFEVPVECLSNTEMNHTVIVESDGGNLAAGMVLRAYDPRGLCVGTRPVVDDGTLNTAITLWGQDAMDPNRGGLRQGEAFRIVAVVDGNELPVSYAVQSGPSTYQPNGITVVTNTIVSEPGEITVGFRDAAIAVRGAFQREIDVSGSFGAIILEVRGEGAELSSITVSPDGAGALDTYVSDSLLAAAIAMPGESAYVVSVGAVPSAEAGRLTISSVQAVDSSGNIVQVTLTDAESEYVFLILGDVDGDGAVALADLRSLFLDLIGVDPLSPEQRQRGDIAPFPTGNEAVTIQDFFALARAVVRGQWPDGSEL